jgi:multidrug transporter EmrE-like cation transporter
VSGTGIDSSIVFGINNTGIVVLSVLTGYLVFNEKLRMINYLGIMLSIIAILMFSYA